MILRQHHSVPPSPGSAIIALNTQVANYARAIAAGIPHDLGEAQSILYSAQQLVQAVEAAKATEATR